MSFQKSIVNNLLFCYCSSQLNETICVHLFSLLVLECLQLPWRNCSNTGTIIMGMLEATQGRVGRKCSPSLKGCFLPPDSDSALASVRNSFLWDSIKLSSYFVTSIMATFVITAFFSVIYFSNHYYTACLLLFEQLELCAFDQILYIGHCEGVCAGSLTHICGNGVVA